MGGRPDELHDAVSGHGVDVAQTAFKERGIRLVFGWINGVRGKVVREDNRALPDRFDLQIVPGRVRGIIIGSRVAPELKDDGRERELHLLAELVIQVKFHRLAIRDDFHPLQSAVVEGRAVEGGNVRAAARG